MLESALISSALKLLGRKTSTDGGILSRMPSSIRQPADPGRWEVPLAGADFANRVPGVEVKHKGDERRKKNGNRVERKEVNKKQSNAHRRQPDSHCQSETLPASDSLGKCQVQVASSLRGRPILEFRFLHCSLPCGESPIPPGDVERQRQNDCGDSSRKIACIHAGTVSASNWLSPRLRKPYPPWGSAHDRARLSLVPVDRRH